MTIPNQAEPKYSYEQIERRASAIEGRDMVSADMLRSLLASRPSTPDKAGVSGLVDAMKSISEIEWKRAATNFCAHTAAMTAKAALTHFASKSAEAVRDGERYRSIRNPPDEGDAMCAWSTTSTGVLSKRGLFDGPLTGEKLDAAVDLVIAIKEQSHD